MDFWKAALGWWPYRCEHCRHRFYARTRSLAEPQKKQKPTAAPAKSEGPAMAFRTEPVKPHAKVVISADTHEQLNHILLALDRAINSYQPQTDRSKQNEYTHAH